MEEVVTSQAVENAIRDYKMRTATEHSEEIMGYMVAQGLTSAETLAVLQTASAMAIIDYSALNETGTTINVDVGKAFDTCVKFKDNIDAIIHIYYSTQSNVIVEAKKV